MVVVEQEPILRLSSFSMSSRLEEIILQHQPNSSPPTSTTPIRTRAWKWSSIEKTVHTNPMVKWPLLIRYYWEKNLVGSSRMEFWSVLLTDMSRYCIGYVDRRVWQRPGKALCSKRCWTRTLCRWFHIGLEWNQLGMMYWPRWLLNGTEIRSNTPR